MRVLLIAVGSRGDAEPFCALADALVRRGAGGHQADLFLQTDLQHLAPEGADVHELPFTMNDFYRYAGSPSRGGDHPNPRVGFVGAVADIIAELVLPCASRVLEVARQRPSDIIVTSSLARPLAFLLGAKLELPVAVVHLQPLAPTRHFPHYSDAKECVAALSSPVGPGSDATSETYLTLERFQHDFLGERLEKAYDSLGVPMVTFDGFLRPALAGELPEVLIINSFCGEIVRTPPDAGQHVHHVGPLADEYIPQGWTPPRDLVAFIEGCPAPPVCIGYGSMPFDKALVVLEALQAAGERAVLVGDALKAAAGENDWAKTNIFQVSAVPYAWLLPRCSMMLSHGGAGVVAASLRAGIPPVISPLMGDQFFWAALLEAQGVGRQAGASMPQMTAEDVVVAIQQARPCQAAAEEVAEAMRTKPSGAEALVEVLEVALS